MYASVKKKIFFYSCNHELARIMWKFKSIHHGISRAHNNQAVVITPSSL